MQPHVKAKTWTGVGAALLVAGMSATTVPPALAAGSPQASSTAVMTSLTPYAGIGKTVRWQAKGLPANQTLNLEWETATGTWKVEGQALIGDEYTFGEATIGTVTTTAAGTAEGSFAVPAGFGGVHSFGLATTAGTPEASTSVTVTMAATISQTTEPEGGFFDIHVNGLGYGGGYNAYDAEYGVLYDNHYMGFISGVTTEGVANFQVRAEGVGAHEISIINSPVEGPYLNQQQSPYPWFGQFDWTVHVTPAVPKTVVDPVAATAVADGTNLTVTPGAGYVGTPFTLAGSNLPKDTTLTLDWQTQSGNRVTASQYAADQMDIGTVTTNAQGAFTETLKVPSTLGGPPHTIRLLDGSKIVGQSSFRILPELVGVSPEVVKEGQPFIVHLTGVGWTEYDNIYAVDYDNAYVGYGCGFNSQGDVQIVLRAAGAPGYHFIDIYPSPYESSSHMPNWYGMPQLTYAQDHPGDTLPAFHVVIQVVS